MNKIDAANTAWMLTSTVLVLFMTLPGLALFYGGLVRAKNALSVLMQCFSIACAVTIDRAESNELAWVTIDRAVELMPHPESHRVFRKIERLLRERSLP